MRILLKKWAMKITKPTLLLDEVKCRNNLNRMKVKAVNTIFRPHFKTHQSAQIGEWFKEAGVTRITVSSVTMAFYFANYGWKNILIAFPFNILETEGINELPIMTEVFLTVESVETVKHLGENIERNVNIYIKIDTGYHRTGLAADQKNTIEKILGEIENYDNLKFTGFLAHFGNTYNARNTLEIKHIYQDSVKTMQTLKERYFEKYPQLIISIGDTPSCNIIENFAGVDEIRPGNFIFYDLMQVQLGVCEEQDIALVLACPVTAIHPNRNEIVIYGGGVHLSKELLIKNEGAKTFGKVVELNETGWSKPLPGTFVSNVSQEHGVIKTTTEFVKKIKIGDIIGVLPVHACMTANLADSYLTVDNKVLEKMRSS